MEIIFLQLPYFNFKGVLFHNPNFDFFNYCGITRPVKIYTTPKTYIHDITVTSDIDFGKAVPSATLHYEVDIEGADKDNTACKV